MNPTRYPDIDPSVVTITINEARELAKKYGKDVSIATIIKWVDTHEPKLGHQPAGNGGRWYVYYADFLKFITGGKEPQSHGENIETSPSTRPAAKESDFKSHTPSSRRASRRG